MYGRELKSMILPVSEITKGLNNIFESVRLIRFSLTPIIPEFSKVFSSITTLAENYKYINEVLAESEYELAPQIIDTNSLLKLKGKRFKPAITSKLIGVTRRDEFIEEVGLLFNSTSLKKRWLAIKQALIAHQARQYYLSTPIFIAQAEGIFTDWLVLLKIARRKNGRVVSYTSDLHKKTKKLDSLSAKVIHARENINTEGLLKIAIDDVLTRTVPKRNSILHGEISNYGTAKNSTQALLLVLLFAGVLESGTDKSKSHT